MKTLLILILFLISLNTYSQSNSGYEFKSIPELNQKYIDYNRAVILLVSYDDTTVTNYATIKEKYRIDAVSKYQAFLECKERFQGLIDQLQREQEKQTGIQRLETEILNPIQYELESKPDTIKFNIQEDHYKQ